MSKTPKSDGNLDLVDQSILLAAQDQQKWIEERRKNWPTRERIAKRQAEEKLNPPAPKRTATDAQPNGAGSASAGNTNGASAPNRPKNIVCRYFLRGKCNAGPRCRFSHDLSKKDQEEKRPAPPPENRIYKRYEAPVKSSLFVKLVQTDHDAEDDRFLDFVAYLKNIKALD